MTIRVIEVLSSVRGFSVYIQFWIHCFVDMIYKLASSCHKLDQSHEGQKSTSVDVTQQGHPSESPVVRTLVLSGTEIHGCYEVQVCAALLLVDRARVQSRVPVGLGMGT